MKNLIAISAPSGTGKTTICRALQDRDSNLHFSLSLTTRPKRDYEKNGFDYLFIAKEEFEKMIKNNEFLEYENVHGFLYGTSKKTLEDAIDKNELLLLEVDVRGAMSIRSNFPENTYTIFILPPSYNDLKLRLEKRGTDSPERIKKRLERLQMEMEYQNKFDCSVVNDDLENATTKILNIIKKVSKGVKYGT